MGNKNITDFILDSPILFIVIGLILLAVILFLIYKGKTVKLWGLEIKDKETKTETPKNVNKGINTGIIGDNSKIINLQDKPIILSDQSKKQILNIINDKLKQNNNNKLISITSDLGNPRSEKLAMLIFGFLKTQGFETGNGISWAISANPNDGVNIYLKNNIINVRVYNV